MSWRIAVHRLWRRDGRAGELLSGLEAGVRQGPGLGFPRVVVAFTFARYTRSVVQSLELAAERAVPSIGMGKLMVAIGVAIAPRFARLARGSTLAVREMEYVQASRAIGNSDLRTMAVHVLPNIVGELTAMASLWIATAIRTEANLSFVGLGVQPPNPSWGGMIRDGLNLLGTAPWLSVVPGAAIFLAALSFSLLGDGLRDAIDPKSRNQS